MFIKICQWVVKIKNANKGEEVKIQKNVLTPFIDGPRTKFPDTFKGQLISKCLYEIIVWTKMPTKILIVSALALSGQKLSNFLLVFWSKQRLQKDILKLTDL